MNHRYEVIKKATQPFIHVYYQLIATTNRTVIILIKVLIR